MTMTNDRMGLITKQLDEQRTALNDLELLIATMARSEYLERRISELNAKILSLESQLATAMLLASMDSGAEDERDDEKTILINTLREFTDPITYPTTQSVFDQYALNGGNRSLTWVREMLKRLLANGCVSRHARTDGTTFWKVLF
jgi:hypothetical protein